MNCVFFGHSNTSAELNGKLKDVIVVLMNEGVERFYVGNNGNFDCLAQRALCEIEKEGYNVKWEVVISYIGEAPLCDMANKTLFPSGQEKALPRFAISKRNEWLLKNADVMIVYLKNKMSNTYKYVKRAEKKDIRIINLAEE